MTTDINKIAKQRRRRKTRSDIMKRRLILLAIVVVGALIAFEFGKLGYIRYFELEKQMKAEQKINKDQKAELAGLKEEARMLGTVEGKKELARSAGLVGSNEVPIIISDTKGKKADKQAPADR